MVGGGGRLVVAMGMAALAMLAGCAEPPSSPVPSASAIAAAPPSAVAIVPAAAEPMRNEGPRPGLPPVERPQVHLIGMSTAEIERLLGHPRFVRHDGAAQIWRFANQSCILDVFFYREPKGFRVRHFELRAPTIGEPPPRPCSGDVTMLLQAKSE